MAAYASLVSLMDLVEQIKHHPEPPVSLDPKQARSLTETVSFLQGFLEDFHSLGFSQEIQALESRITDVVHAAEDVIESQILLISDLRNRRWIPASRISNLSTGFYEGLQRVITDMKFIEKRAMDAKKKSSTFKDDDQLPPRRSLLPPLGSSFTENTAATTMVGFDDISNRIMDRLTRNQSRRDIVTIVGMGGSGKTTLARNIYEKPLIKEHFHTCSWVTISQEWVVREVLIDILLCQSNLLRKEELSREQEDDLGDKLYKSLFGRKYLIVMDDVWSIEAWNRLKFFFPDNNNGSRIMITTRLSRLAFDLTGSRGVEMDLLDEDTSWDLLCKKVFAVKSCPLELEEIGMKIARNCRGLPLSIVTIGGLLAKSRMTREYWEYVAENLSLLVNSEDDNRCLRILSLSYITLPVHLKSCFLYMGLFPEDERIHASYLIKLWVAEGFLKPISGKVMELVGEDYLKDLVERNLVFVHQWGSTRKIKLCVVHDLLRDLCLREAQKEKFFSVVRFDNLQDHGISNTQRRIAIHHSTSNEEGSPHRVTPYSAPFLRSCIIGSPKGFKSFSLKSVRLLRILAEAPKHPNSNVDDIVPLVNLRFLCWNNGDKYIPSLWSMSWNLQTLISGIGHSELDIWNMPQLRHVKIALANLSNPPPSSGRLLILENLQMLGRIQNFKCSEEVVKRIPNIKKLSIWYDVEDEDGTSSSMDDYCLNNLGRLQNLESLEIDLHRTKSYWNRWDGFALPYSLKKLSLGSIHLNSDTMIRCGSLPHLEVLKLLCCTFTGDEWNRVEGQFCRLKYLELYYCDDFKYWNNADSTHFPRLEHLRITGLTSFEEFPWGIGEIPTLRLIYLEFVRYSVVMSSKRMLEEQEEQLGNVTLRIQVIVLEEQGALKESLASNNFEVYFYGEYLDSIGTS